MRIAQSGKNNEDLLGGWRTIDQPQLLMRRLLNVLI